MFENNDCDHFHTKCASNAREFLSQGRKLRGLVLRSRFIVREKQVGCQICVLGVPPGLHLLQAQWILEGLRLESRP